MAGSTPNLGLYLPGGGSTGVWTPNEVADIDTINQNFVTLDTWAGKIGNETNRQINYVGTAAAMGGPLVPSPKDGDTYQETDGNKILWKRLGGAWVTNEGGLYLIRPTLVSPPAGVSVDATGALVFSAVAAGATVNVDPIFSSRFENYRAIAHWNAKPNASGSQVIGLASGAVAGGSSYSLAYQALLSGTRNDGQAVSQTSFKDSFLTFNGFAASAVSDILSPNRAFPTFIISNIAGVGGLTHIQTEEACLNTTDQLTGLRLVLGTGATWTGRIKFYGYS